MTQTKAIQPINPRPIEDIVDQLARDRDKFIPPVELTPREIQLNEIKCVLKDCGCDSMSQTKGTARIKEILGW